MRPRRLPRPLEVTGLELTMPIRVYTILGLLVSQTLPCVSQSRSVDILEKTAEYRQRLEELAPLHEVQLKSARAEVDRLGALFQAGLVARVKVEEAERTFAEARTRLEDARLRIRECAALSAEVTLAIQLENDKLRLEAVSHEAVIFSPGNPGWSLSVVSRIAQFYYEHFSVPLPVSALGQTALHSRLGFAHEEAADVAVHPDSAEGRALMDYLRASGIPFIAFRQAVPGSATGAHIHLGPPSLRVAAASMAEGGAGS